MRIDRIRKQTVGGRGRVTAQAAWEVSDAAPLTLFVETGEQFASDLEPSPDACLVAPTEAVNIPLFSPAQLTEVRSMRLSTFILALLVTTATAMATATVHAQTPTVETVRKLPPKDVTRVRRPVEIPDPTHAGELRAIEEAAPSPGRMNAALPDLVIREIRRDAQGTYGIRVANQGVQRAATFNIMLSLTTAAAAPGPSKVVETPALAGGGQLWVTVSIDPPPIQPTHMSARADPAYILAISSTNSDGTPNPGRWTWKRIDSRIRESDEENNFLSVAIPPG